MSELKRKMSNQDKIKILYIGGSGRSGSTLLLRMLGQLDGFLSVGELWHVWQEGFIDNRLCSCGNKFNQCEFWTAVVDEAFGGFQNVNLDEIKAIDGSVKNNFNLPQLTFPFLRTLKFQKTLDMYLCTLTMLYRAIQKVSGCRVIVDSSKGPRYAYALNQIPDIDLHIVHLIRDSRAVAYSWQKVKRKPEVYWKTDYLERPDPISTALNWDIVNILFQVFKNRDVDYFRVHYEDMIRQPDDWFSQIVEHLGEDGSGIRDILKGNSVHLRIDHTASGNPNRFQHGPIKLRPDMEWEQKMAKIQKFIVTALTFPLLQRYGYLSSSKSQNDRVFG